MNEYAKLAMEGFVKGMLRWTCWPAQSGFRLGVNTTRYIPTEKIEVDPMETHKRVCEEIRKAVEGRR